MLTIKNITESQFKNFVSSCYPNTDRWEIMHNRFCAWVGDMEVKSEIKSRCMTFGFGLSSSDLALVKQAAIDNGYTVSGGSLYINVAYNNDLPVLDQWLELVQLVNSLDLQGKAERNSGIKVFDKRYCARNIAARYVLAVENQDQQLLDLSRGLLDSDEFDADISMNKKDAVNDYREHVVPCIVIHNEAVRMALAGESAVKIASMIHRNLIIVHIPTTVAKYIDYELGLQTCMPKGWNFGDDPFARLVAANYNF